MGENRWIVEIKTSGFFHIFFLIIIIIIVVFFLLVLQMEITNIQYEYLFTSIINVQLDYMKK